jgi:hypothetical protein
MLRPAPIIEPVVVDRKPQARAAMPTTMRTLRAVVRSVIQLNVARSISPIRVAAASRLEPTRKRVEAMPSPASSRALA